MASLFVTGPMHVYLNLLVPRTVTTQKLGGNPFGKRAAGLFGGFFDVVARAAGKVVTRISTLVRVPFYLGTTIGSPDINIKPHLRPLYKDDYGDQPAEYMASGRSAIISCDFSRWDELTYAQAVTANPLGVRGTDLDTDIGTLLRTEGWAYEIMLVFPFSAKQIYANVGLPAGYRFLCGINDAENFRGGARPKKIRLVWHCIQAQVFKTPPTPLTPPPNPQPTQKQLDNDAVAQAIRAAGPPPPPVPAGPAPNQPDIPGLVLPKTGTVNAARAAGDARPGQVVPGLTPKGSYLFRLYDHAIPAGLAIA